MFSERIFSIQNWWDNNGLEMLVMLSLAIIFVLALFRLGKRGNWSSWYFYDSGMTKLGDRMLRPSRGPPRESKGELECRRVLQEIFRRPFDKARPSILRNPVTGNNFNLEIDCYCEEMKLGVEYSGIQHYKFSPYFHKNNEAFLNQKYRDELKRRMCVDNGICLIEVPYTVKHENIRSYLVTELRRNGFLS